MAWKKQQQGTLEINRAMIDRGREKTESFELDWPDTDCTRVEPTGEAKERETSAQLETHENGRVGGETSHVE